MEERGPGGGEQPEDVKGLEDQVLSQSGGQRVEGPGKRQQRMEPGWEETGAQA